MNFIKAQKEIFNALCNGNRTGQFSVDGNNVFVTPNGYMAYILPKSLIYFSLEKIREMKPLPIKELIQDQYELTLTNDLRIIDKHRTARRLKGVGKNVLVNVKFLSCFQNPHFYQQENPLSGIVVTEQLLVGKGKAEEIPVGFILPIRCEDLQGDYYEYADNMEG